MHFTAPLSPTQIRLLEATEQLVYADGIRATGMDSIVKASGVARKSIYRHYPNKAALVAAALARRDERWMQWFVAETSAGTPCERLLAMFPALGRWFRSEGFHGCAFINAAGEIGDADSPIRAVSRLHKQRLHDYVRELAEAAGLADPGEAARQWLVLIDGAIAVALVTGDASIADSAGRAAQALLAGPHPFSPTPG